MESRVARQSVRTGAPSSSGSTRFADEAVSETIREKATKHTCIVVLPTDHHAPKGNIRRPQNIQKYQLRLALVVAALGFDPQTALPVMSFLVALFNKLGFRWFDKNLRKAIGQNGVKPFDSMKPQEICDRVLKLGWENSYSLETLVTLLQGWLCVNGRQVPSSEVVFNTVQTAGNKTAILLGNVIDLRQDEAFDPTKHSMELDIFEGIEIPGEEQVTYYKTGKTSARIPAGYGYFLIDPNTFEAEQIANARITGECDGQTISLLAREATSPEVNTLKNRAIELINRLDAVGRTVRRNGNHPPDVATVNKVNEKLVAVLDESDGMLSAMAHEARAPRGSNGSGH